MTTSAEWRGTRCYVAWGSELERAFVSAMLSDRSPIGCRSAAALVSQACRSVSLKRPEQPPNLTLASVQTTRRLGLRHASLREPRDDRQCVHFSRTQGEEIAGHGPGLNPEPDIYAWEKPDIMAWGLQPNCAVLNVMSRCSRRTQALCIRYAPRTCAITSALATAFTCASVHSSRVSKPKSRSRSFSGTRLISG